MTVNAITSKELEYVIDCMSNEDLLMKQCTSIVNATTQQELKSLCQQMVQTHQDHYSRLLQCLEQHQQMAPAQPQ